MAKKHCVTSEIAVVSLVRIVRIACGSQHRVVQAAAI